ncbi:GDSL-type esterase/lipase family protein [Gracilibacillus suaedae]|uniref:GDSL-type esterase/lipase family protein n=1 Tax=Gracilibacillus suaedae TaxID=2820273 RepID=UPI001ABE2B25|nr:GDSL-type esterase/lipase family protein [Gracilibacillus suaedae]
MVKKVVLSVLIGVFAIFATACGNNQDEKETVTTDVKESYKSFYSKSVFLGDSLLIGLSDVLEESNVISNAGATALFAIEEVANIANKKPEHVYIMLGSDDLLMPVDNPKKDSLKNYAKLIEKLKENLPNAKIHVLSVPPVTKEAIKTEPRYKHIPDYNKELEKMAVTEKIDYIDLSSIFEKNQTLYKEDGIHFKTDFYPILLNHIKEHVQSSQSNEG